MKLPQNKYAVIFQNMKSEINGLTKLCHTTSTMGCHPAVKGNSYHYLMVVLMDHNLIMPSNKSQSND